MIKPLKTNAGLRSICVLAFLLIVFGASAQNRISLNVQNKPLRTILSAITQQSGYNFVYSSELKEIDSTMTVKCDNAEISAVLDKLFADRQVNYKINGKNIALSPARVAGQPAQKSRIKITGTITDDSGIPIPGVAVTNLQENTTAIS
ncbi:MAG: secretin and TonB N-terminal domain-containing protein, partial [Bacteroidales bacterium]